MAAGNRRLILRPIDSIVQAGRRERCESARLFLMNIDLAALPDDVGALQQLVRSLVAERTSLREANAEIERLDLIIKQLQRHQFGRRAERLDNDQLHLGFEDLEVDLARVEAKLRSAKAKPDKPDGERPSLPAHLERENVRLDVEDQACTCCGGALHLIGETVSEMLNHVPARLRVIRICRPHATAAGPAGPSTRRLRQNGRSPKAWPPPLSAASTTFCLGTGGPRPLSTEPRARNGRLRDFRKRPFLTHLFL